MRIKQLIAYAAIAIPQKSQATETISCTYDAKGRLVQVVKTGSVNNVPNTLYQHDKADNRLRVVVTNASR